MVWIQTHAPDGAPVTLATTHFAWPFPPGLQSAQRRVLAERLHQQPTDMMILGGDFNTTPWSFGMRNQDQLLAPLKRQAAPGASWPARLDTLQRPWGFPILPIDHLYSGPGWRAVGATRLRIPGSDHLAIEATFVRNRPR
jgi:endonuclease/exonuclease/phosphatase (EEP) superfamily protein YafD